MKNLLTLFSLFVFAGVVQASGASPSSSDGYREIHDMQFEEYRSDYVRVTESSSSTHVSYILVENKFVGTLVDDAIGGTLDQGPRRIPLDETQDLRNQKDPSRIDVRKVNENTVKIYFDDLIWPANDQREAVRSQYDILARIAEPQTWSDYINGEDILLTLDDRAQKIVSEQKANGSLEAIFAAFRFVDKSSGTVDHQLKIAPIQANLEALRFSAKGQITLEWDVRFD